ncbi:hypothetical protein OG401_14485 [Kitasatospora purpeofusca]|uniref:hypothetical protein n=1 Tax=Kitasatospora purpeofusca TaxID=67352 RepID=UPI002256A7E8|nr:hypothetical protein [Kitasatospora purpeofusca]MCX4685507.1 hypothetical protein [Kitasatospora purpeofusca]
MSAVSVDLPWFAKATRKVGAPAAFAAALIMSVPGEIHLAEVAGWSPGYARLMPVCVSVYAASAAVMADVSRRFNLPGQRSAQTGAILALILAIFAQDISHLLQLGYMGTSATLVKLVSAIPGLVVAHLLHMGRGPKKTAIEVEAPDVPEDQGDEDGQLSLIDMETGKARPRRGKRGKPKVAPEVVQAAAEKIRAKGEKVTGPALADELELSRRSGSRYLKELSPEPQIG